MLGLIADALFQEQRAAALMLLWALVGVSVITLLWPHGRGRRRARQIFALALLSFREGIRLKILWTGVALACLPILLAYFSDADGTHVGRARLLLNVSLSCGEILGAALIVLLSALSVAREIETRIMHTLGVKPVPRWVILLGKALGFWSINIIFLLGLLLLGAILIRAVPLRPESRIENLLATSGSWDDLRRNALTTRHFSRAQDAPTGHKFIRPGQSFEQRFPISSAATHGEAVALRFLLSSSNSFASHISNLKLTVGYENEEPFVDRVMSVPQERPFEIYLEAKDLIKTGVLLVTLLPTDKGVSLVVPQMEGIKLGVKADGLLSNMSKSLLLMALQSWILALIITSWSGALSFPVAVAFGLLLILGGEMSRYAIELMQSNATNMRDIESARGWSNFVTQCLNFILLLLPDFRAAGGPAAFVEGATLSMWAIAHAVFWMGLARGMAWALPGILLFRAREVGK